MLASVYCLWTVTELSEPPVGAHVCFNTEDLFCLPQAISAFPFLARRCLDQLMQRIVCGRQNGRQARWKVCRHRNNQRRHPRLRLGRCEMSMLNIARLTREWFRNTAVAVRWRNGLIGSADCVIDVELILSRCSRSGSLEPHMQHGMR